ncbi:Isochorismatase hydrolase [Byssothecium circinans]|uniref:Isochorismatase hydrolase n=1 Tax=Byssothecium circinans TaxID=147558 RepID=A0A6A5UDC6_9PLEO|nr:Isochorismatase hydrolase [Byssothecium circinans]
MQNSFAPMTTTALPNIVRLSQLFAQRGWPQYFTQHGHAARDFEEPVRNQLVRKWGVGGSIAVNSSEWEFMPAIRDLLAAATASSQTSGSRVISKNVYDAFYGVVDGETRTEELEGRLRSEGVGRVVIVGVMTDCCCDSTGRSAFNRGFETWLVSDATGSASKSQHERGLKAWGFGYGDVLTTEEAVGRLCAD